MRVRGSDAKKKGGTLKRGGAPNTPPLAQNDAHILLVAHRYRAIWRSEDREMGERIRATPTG